MQSTMMPVLPHETIEDLYPRYAGAWEVLLVEAAARHVLSLEEFREEMRDDRLEKHVVIDDDDVEAEDFASYGRLLAFAERLALR